MKTLHPNSNRSVNIVLLGTTEDNTPKHPFVISQSRNEQLSDIYESVGAIVSKTSFHNIVYWQHWTDIYYDLVHILVYVQYNMINLFYLAVVFVLIFHSLN